MLDAVAMVCFKLQNAAQQLLGVSIGGIGGEHGAAFCQKIAKLGGVGIRKALFLGEDGCAADALT